MQQITDPRISKNEDLYNKSLMPFESLQAPFNFNMIYPEFFYNSAKLMTNFTNNNANPSLFNLIQSPTPRNSTSSEGSFNQTPTTSSVSPHPPVEFELLDKKLWLSFNKHTTEMIVTRPGRKMFPHFKVRIQGLDSKAYYNVYFSLRLVNNYRYRFNHGAWSKGEFVEISDSDIRVPHHDCNGKTTGAFWMRQEIIFDKVHLTNQSVQGGRKISLRTMHKYQPRVSVFTAEREPQLVGMFEPPETQFIAVTAYANEKIRKLKIDNNPFAKGFRTGARKRTLDLNDDSNSKSETATKLANYFTNPCYSTAQTAYNPYLSMAMQQCAATASLQQHSFPYSFQMLPSFQPAPFPVNYSNFNSAFHFMPTPPQTTTKAFADLTTIPTNPTYQETIADSTTTNQCPASSPEMPKYDEEQKAE